MTDRFGPAPEPATELGRYRTLSATAGLRVSPLALGAMSIGDAWNTFLGHMDKDQAFALLDAYVAAGGNFIDTANHYQDEQSEIWLGEWLTARQARDRVVLATKYSSDFRIHAVGKNTCANNSGNNRRSLRRSLAASLRKLQTDYVDLLYVHWWDYATSIPELMQSLHALVQAGQVLYLGVSDTPAWVVSAANTYAETHGMTPFSVYQGRWNVLRRDFERDIVPMARHFGMALVPWDVLGGGKFQTRAAVEARAAAAATATTANGSSSSSGGGLRTLYEPTGRQSAEEAAMSAALERVAVEHGTDSVTAIALAYVRSKAPRVFPVLGGRKPEQWQDHIRALSIQLTAAQVAYLESIKPFDFGFPHDFIGQDPLATGQMTPQVAASVVVDFSEPLTRR
ncbi:aryl-alcohol dehydrogenase Aad14 [Niveomyces insectorum RCEF 264]|uniref:Aryl-alcohol dehydrogenase Aad14 n=1 Tax=Niveomyces insectorum RCEF 264 TaxID=1081102 RepID=A0A162J1S1_9HYPO|nr:aryl-alcohol dehydrogenase Aad14 [Niveomyces insectorum RCEF 264]